ncbi:hypothetical protein BDA96_07G233000 [Sorghum bicolor]|uniref:Uncharacterized protein n=1 Tax=Sorghum bicolor TaxID=4558 RepID=A0A921QMZ5_SORBI|nr:hypothetical protein BDA96_07G233000 [Sorghum bicolor]
MWQRTASFPSNQQRVTNRACVTNNEEPSKHSFGRDLVRTMTLTGCLVGSQA